MNKALCLSLICAATLSAGIHETKDGRFLQLFSDNDPQSKIVAEVPAENRGLHIGKCRTPKRGIVWCKVTYARNGIRLEGWSDKKSLDAIEEKPNRLPTFEKRFGGRYHDVGTRIVTLPDGFLIAGYTESFGRGQNDGYVIKTDRFGNKLWSQTYGGRYDDIIKDIIPVKGGFMFSGTTASFGNKIQSLYAGRIRTDGTLMWESGYYADPDDRYAGNALVPVNDSHVLIAGYEDHIKFFNSEIQCYLTAISLHGIAKWQMRYGGEDDENANSIVRVKGGYVFAGFTDTWGHGDKDVYVVKIDESGKRVWHNAFGYDDNEIGNRIIATRDGGYIVVGTTDSARRNGDDVFIVKIDKHGKRQWQRHYGGEYDEEGNDIVETEDGYVVVGSTKSTPHLDKQAYVFKIDRYGNPLWQKTYGGKDDDAANAIVEVDDGFAVVGYSEGRTERGKDVYLLKIDRNGNL